MPQKLVVGNWKMNGSKADNAALLGALKSLDAADTSAKVVVCPSYVYLEQASQLLESHIIQFGAQDVSLQAKGAFTSEVSASMLVDLGCDYVIVGHSERREYHDETDNDVANKAQIAIDVGLTPIVCVGETLEQREAEQTLSVVGEQIAAVKNVVGENLSKIVIAYEPVWAIGTGLTATPEQAQEVHAFIRGQLGEASDKIAVLYGGSVKAGNAADLFAKNDIDGALVGGASLIADDFIAIAKAAK